MKKLQTYLAWQSSKVTQKSRRQRIQIKPPKKGNPSTTRDCPLIYVLMPTGNLDPNDPHHQHGDEDPGQAGDWILEENHAYDDGTHSTNAGPNGVGQTNWQVFHSQGQEDPA